MLRDDLLAFDYDYFQLRILRVVDLLAKILQVLVMILVHRFGILLVEVRTGKAVQLVVQVLVHRVT